MWAKDGGGLGEDGDGGKWAVSSNVKVVRSAEGRTQAVR